MRRWILPLALVLACSKATPVPRDTQLWRVEGWTDVSDGIRTAPATIIVFRSSGEFVSLQTTVIERADETVYLLARAPRHAVVGRWSQSGEEVSVQRTKVSRPGDCGSAAFRVVGHSVDSSGVTYSPVTRLVAPEFESWLAGATAPCP
ncbi:MAG TPA: hypothetical protein VMS98_02915 [Thermoanaerobaculia bacterium]|nr:hypothetical protein [Thermoanaerobaculia bacterium]